MHLRSSILAFAAVAAAAVFPAPALAQPKAGEPTVEVRIRSVNDLLDKAEYIGELVDQGDPIKQIRGLVQQLSAEGKGLEGIDPKRPFGAYGILNTDVESSPVVAMIPIADEKRLLAALQERLGIEPEKVEGGALRANVPLINQVYLRFANDYLYVAREAGHIEPKGLIAPKTFFAKDDGSVASIIVRFDRIPDDLKTFVIGQLEHQVQEGLKKDADTKSPLERKVGAIVADAFVGSAKSIFDEGKDLSLRVFVDPKADELSLELNLTGKDGTSLAKTIAGLEGKSSLPAGIVRAQTPVAQGSAKIELTDDLKKRLEPVIDAAIEEAVKQAKPNEQKAARRVLTTLAPTLKAGEFDGAFSFTGPDAKGKYMLLAAGQVKDGKEIEKLAKDFAAFVKAEDAEFTFDVEKVGSFAVHKVVLAKADADFERIFGTKNIWLATSEDCIALSIEPDGSVLRAGLKAKPAATQVAGGQVSFAQVLPLAEKGLRQDEVKALIKDAFGGESPAGKDTITLTVEGGKQLTARLKARGKVLTLGTMLQQFKGK
jgi:hypothetical protein